MNGSRQGSDGRLSVVSNLGFHRDGAAIVVQALLMNEDAEGSIELKQKLNYNRKQQPSTGKQMFDSFSYHRNPRSRRKSCLDIVLFNF